MIVAVDQLSLATICNSSIEANVAANCKLGSRGRMQYNMPALCWYAAASAQMRALSAGVVAITVAVWPIALDLFTNRLAQAPPESCNGTLAG